MSNTIKVSLKIETIEHVMRSTYEDALVIPFLEAQPESKEAHTAVGRLISETPTRLEMGSPLMAFAAGTPVDNNWRQNTQTAPGCLWETLQFLTTLYGYPQTDNPYTALETLREQADSDVNA